MRKLSKDTNTAVLHILENDDAEIVNAENGKEGLEKIKSENPHIVLLDLIMQIMDGFEVLENLKKDPVLKKIPVIVLTGHGNMEYREKAFMLGADDIVTKPAAREELMPRVRKYLLSTF